jgi:hypothetical protein
MNCTLEKHKRAGQKADMIGETGEKGRTYAQIGKRIFPRILISAVTTTDVRARTDQRQSHQLQLRSPSYPQLKGTTRHLSLLESSSAGGFIVCFSQNPAPISSAVRADRLDSLHMQLSADASFVRKAIVIVGRGGFTYEGLVSKPIHLET